MRYLITSKRSSVRLTLGYDERGWLCELVVENIEELHQLDSVMRHAPLLQDDLARQFAPEHYNRTVLNVSFAAFWQRYNHKEGKKDTERAWARMTETSRQLAYGYIDRYKSACQRDGKHLMYPASYLRAERWNDHT